jgi:TIR domain-containing protein
MGNAEGAWIFLSHSTRDWESVRRVRNLLEDKGHRPLVFFLKCLTDHSELDGLIRREIEARSWFLLCDSDNARNSSWVQAEAAYIKELPGKYHEQIDLNDAIEAQIERIDRLCKRVTVFLSHHRADEPFARRIREALVERDYSVWSDKEIASGTLWAQEITNAIDRATERGFVLVLLSTTSVESQFVMAEVGHAFKKAAAAAHGANIVPIMLHDPGVIQRAMPPSLRQVLGEIQWFDFSAGDFDTNIARLIAHIRTRPMD